jgi:hypothetical protein
MIDYSSDKIAQSNWFPTYYSKHKNDYISVNGVHYRCEKLKCEEDCQKNNPNYWANNRIINDLIDNIDIDIACYGDSFTFGQMLPKEKSWPHLLSEILKIKTFNFGVPAGGIDVCFLNFKKSIEDFQIKKAIFLLPNIQRKLLRFKLGSNYFKFPIVAKIDWQYPDNIATSLGITPSLMNNKINNIKKLITDDLKMFNYNKKIIQKILKLSKQNHTEVFFSSWSEDTYKLLKEHNLINLLPMFDLNWFSERVANNMHPTYKHYLKWVTLIKNLIH